MGGRCITVLAYDSEPTSLAVNQTDVYWTSGASGRVLRCSSQGCGQQPTVIAQGIMEPGLIALDATNVYFAGSEGMPVEPLVVGCPIAGSSQCTTVVPGVSVSGLATTGGSLYWTVTGNGTGSVWGCVPGDCVPNMLATSIGDPWLVGASASTLMWIAGTTAQATIWSCSPAACSPQQIVPGIGEIAGAASDTSTVFFTTSYNGQTLDSCPNTGCAGAPTTLASGLLLPSDVVTDGVNVYFTTNPMGPGGAVLKCPVSGCGAGPTIIGAFCGASTPISLALDATSINWVDINLGMVLRAPK